jgi:hypothetical protein
VSLGWILASARLNAYLHDFTSPKGLQVNLEHPDPLITQRNSSLDGNAAFRKPANTGCGAPEGRSDLAEIFHLLGAQLLCDRSYAQTD